MLFGLVDDNTNTNSFDKKFLLIKPNQKKVFFVESVTCRVAQHTNTFQVSVHNDRIYNMFFLKIETKKVLLYINSWTLVSHDYANLLNVISEKAPINIIIRFLMLKNRLK